MNKLPVIIALVTAATLLSPAKSIGQNRACPMPENGFWQLISNHHQSDKVTVQFFDLSGHLVYQEHLTGASPNWHKRSTCRALNKSLQVALTAYNENRQPSPGMAQNGQPAIKLP